MTKQKNYSFLIKNFKKLTSKYKDIKLLLDQKLNIVSNNNILVHQLLDKFSLDIKGAVKNPGKLLLGAKYNYQEILDIAGGFTNDSNIENLDVLYPVRKENGDIIFEQKFVNFETNDRFNLVEFGSVIRVPKFSNELNLGQVKILGAVKEPGNYQILAPPRPPPTGGRGKIENQWNQEN